jgi:hypothetical protein
MRQTYGVLTNTMQIRHRSDQMPAHRGLNTSHNQDACDNPADTAALILHARARLRLL